MAPSLEDQLVAALFTIIGISIAEWLIFIYPRKDTVYTVKPAKATNLPIAIPCQFSAQFRLSNCFVFIYQYILTAQMDHMPITTNESTYLQLYISVLL